MGSFYTNITLKGPNQLAIAQGLEGKRLCTVISSTVGDFTVVYDAENESQDGSVYELGRSLSDEHRCIALSVMNHDDKILYFRLYKNGDLIDDYCSSPNYFEGPPAPPWGGNALVLCEIFDAMHSCATVERILRYNNFAVDEKPRYIWEVDRHHDLCAALKLPMIAVGVGCNYIAEDTIPPEYDLRGCLYVIREQGSDETAE